MSVKQLSVFLDNSPGTLSKFTQLMASANVNMIALTIADTTSFGILRCLVAQSAETLKIIANAGYSARLTSVIAAVVPDKPGGLAGVLETLAARGVSIEYCYSFAHGLTIADIGNDASSGAALVLQVDDISKAEEILEKNGVKLLSMDSFALIA
ncbi:MAG: hypothetical protein LBD16_01570 [Oscillospiraceae bacterium]|jgi:hypothetical protein|nr:hypothetical protein [Oscillospiraceae bacterium]